MRTDRRGFLRVVGFGGAVVVGPGAVWADRLRILGNWGEEGDGRDSATGGAEPAFTVGAVSPDFQRVLGGVRVGDARIHGAFLVLWLHGTPGASLGVATLEEARARGALLVTERDQARVAELIVENRSKAHVLLLAGEILLGGKQNRVLTEDILLPPQSGPRNIAVYCVEQGRWAGWTKDFEAKGSFAAPGLRSQIMDRAGQGSVWATVGEYSRRVAAPSATRSYQEIYEKREVKEHLAEVERGIDSRTALGALGAAVFVGQALVGLDLFFDPGLFAREWPKLLRAQALESYRRRDQPGPDERRLRARVEELLAVAGRSEGVLRGSLGAGRLFEFRANGVRGSGLIFDGRVVHAAIL